MSKTAAGRPTFKVLTDAVVATAPPAIPDCLYMHRYVVANASARGAVCNDGSAAVFYCCNCTADGFAHVDSGSFDIALLNNTLTSWSFVTIAAAPGALPSSALPMRSATSSAAPDRDTP